MPPHADVLSNSETDAPHHVDSSRASVKKPSLAHRFRRVLGIPESIKAEVSAHERTGAFDDVDAVNQDPEIMPRIVRKESPFLRRALVGAALLGTAAVHEPQIERAVKAVPDAAEDAADSLKRGLHRMIKNIEAFVARAQHDKKNSYDGVADALREGTGSVGNFADGVRRMPGAQALKHLTGEMREDAEVFFHNARDNAKHGIFYYDQIFLTLEYLHGQISKTQMERAFERAAETRWAVVEELQREGVTSNDKLFPLRAAHKFAAQRTLYARELAGASGIILNGEGNCEALVRHLLISVKNVAPHAVMKVQVLQDHVRFLIEIDEQVYWIDGHSWGELTSEDMKGTVIVDPQFIIKEMLGMEDRKSEGATVVPEKNFGYPTDSMINWSALDGRRASHAAGNGDAPTRMDERKSAKINFADAQARPPRERMRIIEVDPDAFGNIIQYNPKWNKPAAGEKKEVERRMPSPKDVRAAVVSGFIGGNFNDLSPLRGMIVSNVHLNKLSTSEVLPEGIDLSPLADSAIRILNLSSLYEQKLTGSSKLNLNRLAELNINLHPGTVELLNAAIQQKAPLKIVKLNRMQADSGMSSAAWEQMVLNGPLADEMLVRLAQQLKKDPGGIIDISLESPYEGRTITWRYSSDKGWSEDSAYSQTLKQVISDLKDSKDSIRIPGDLRSFNFLKYFNLDVSKVESVILEDIYTTRTDDGVHSEISNVDWSIMKSIPKLKTITLDFGTNNWTPENLDISEIADVGVENITIRGCDKIPLRGQKNVRVIFEPNPAVAQVGAL